MLVRRLQWDNPCTILGTTPGTRVTSVSVWLREYGTTPISEAVIKSPCLQSTFLLPGFSLALGTLLPQGRGNGGEELCVCRYCSTCPACARMASLEASGDWLVLENGMQHFLPGSHDPKVWYVQFSVLSPWHPPFLCQNACRYPIHCLH